jgi:hypothetical protein
MKNLILLLALVATVLPALTVDASAACRMVRRTVSYCHS